MAERERHIFRLLLLLLLQEDVGTERSLPRCVVRLVERTRVSTSRRRGADVSERSPEAQFQLANERTYLAWLRTALALVASDVAAARLLAGQTLPWAWETVGSC